MEVLHTIKTINDRITSLKEEGRKIGFVPTMGALHNGHLHLIQEARKDCDIVVCSIFVNPIQFNNKEDLKKYPRDIERDISLLQELACDIIFVPSEEEMYPEPEQRVWELGNMDIPMEGAFRPGHFQGVATVVKKLFDIVQPDKAYFGQKDYQQLQVIKYITTSLGMPIEIVECPTIRENDGLAMSSRNARLSPKEREVAPILYKTLCLAKERMRFTEPSQLKKEVVEILEKNSLIKVEYIEFVDKDTLEQIQHFQQPERCVICAAIYLGQIRLIDNLKFL
jgi:pantoate--beta-alanine ligase